MPEMGEHTNRVVRSEIRVLKQRLEGEEYEEGVAKTTFNDAKARVKHTREAIQELRALLPAKDEEFGDVEPPKPTRATRAKKADTPSE
jgi:hypothetical protein